MARDNARARLPNRIATALKLINYVTAICVALAGQAHAEDAIKSQSFYEAQASKSWFVFGTKYPSESLRPDVCFARREWVDGSAIELQKDLRDGELSFWFRNISWNYADVQKEPLQEFRVNLYRTDGSLAGGANWTVRFKSKNEVIIPGLNDDFAQFLSQGDVLKFIPPGNIENISVGFENSTKVILAKMRDCIQKYPSVAETDPFTGKGKSDIPSLKLSKVGPTPYSPRSPETTPPSGTDIKMVDRRSFAAIDRDKIAAIATAQKLTLPTYAFAETASIRPLSSLVGAWSNDCGWNDGKGRHVMLIVTEVTATGKAKGFYIWGPPTQLSWTINGAGFRPFEEDVVGDQFTISINPPISVRLKNDRSLALATAASDSPSDKATIDLYPVWQSVQTSTRTDAKADRD